MAEKNDKLLRVKQVLLLVNVSRSTWLAGVKTGRFPMGYKYGKCVFWKESEILSFIDGISERKNTVIVDKKAESKESMETTEISRYSAEEWQIKQLKEKVEQLQSELVAAQTKHINKYGASLQSDEVGGNMLYDWARKKYGKVAGVHLEKRYLMQCGPNMLRRQYALDAAINYLVEQKKVSIWRKKGATMISFA